MMALSSSSMWTTSSFSITQQSGSAPSPSNDPYRNGSRSVILETSSGSLVYRYCATPTAGSSGFAKSHTLRKLQHRSISSKAGRLTLQCLWTIYRQTRNKQLSRRHMDIRAALGHYYLPPSSHGQTLRERLASSPSIYKTHPQTISLPRTSAYHTSTALGTSRSSTRRVTITRKQLRQ